ncbi:MAG: TIM44-like domain-containing protein [Gammaproteobacteria bacterium]|nr:TIM44-like domain-containing protein [Gammaproteobacteria bacterium]
MKNIWAIVAMLFVFAFTATEAQAKKFGGSKTFGRSYQTAPAPAAKPDAPNQTAAPGAAAAAGKRGMLGGLMGGLLAGGLIAALIGGGAFEGIQFMDILIIGLLAFVIFKLLRSRRPVASSPAPVFAGGQGGNNSERRGIDFDNKSSGGAVFTPAGSGFGVSQVPFNLPAGFDLTAFLAGARDHYRTLQDAWNKNDLVKIQEYVSPELYNDLRVERATLVGDQHTEVLFVDAELVRADQIGSRAEVSVKFSGRYRDTVEGVEEPITDIWHLERDLAQAGSPWHIVGIEA